VTTNVKGNILYIDEKTNNGFYPTQLYIDVYMPELKNLKLKGVGDIEISGGKSSDFEITLSGVGDIDAQKYEAENVTVTLSGTGDIKTWAAKSLTGKLSGVGNIFYKGNPSKNINKSGIGEVKKL
jgi:hypothetical protein